MVNSIGIIGTGRLGESLANALKPHCIIKWVCNRKGSSLAGFTSISFDRLSRDMIQAVDCIAICTTDNEIEGVVASICTKSITLEKKLFFHCSGALSVTILQPLQNCGANILAMHPYQTFPYPDSQLLQAIPWLIEGDDAAFALIEPLLKHLNAKIFRTSRILSKEEKLLWHSTAVFSSNFTATLYQIAASLINHLEITSPEEFIRSIAQQTIINAHTSLQKHGHIQMSGPIIRGDMSIVQQELDVLMNVNPLIGTIYKQLSEATLQISTTILNDSPI